jgi:hypothetical protein
MKWKQLKEEIDWGKSDNAIVGNQREIITSDTYKTVKKLVRDAAEFFLPMDLQWFRILGVEQEFLHEYNHLSIPDKAIIDLIFEVKPDAGKPYDDYVGKKLIVDWKSTSGELSTDWRNRYIYSWQWKRYAAITSADLFEFRGVSMKTFFTGQDYKHICGPLILDVPDNNFENVLREYGVVQRQKNQLYLREESVYPRNLPGACFKFQEECEYLRDCQDFTMPQQALVNIEHASYSSDETFKLCPEKYRRNKLKGVREDNVDSQSFIGTLFHRGIAEVYLQFMEKQ